MKSLLFTMSTISIIQIFGIVIVAFLTTQVVVGTAYGFRKFVDKHLMKMAMLAIAIIALAYGVSFAAVKSHNAQSVLDTHDYSLVRDHDTIELKVDSSYFPKTTALKIVSENDSTIQVNYGNKTFSINRSELKKGV